MKNWNVQSIHSDWNYFATITAILFPSFSHSKNVCHWTQRPWSQQRFGHQNFAFVHPTIFDPIGCRSIFGVNAEIAVDQIDHCWKNSHIPVAIVRVQEPRQIWLRCWPTILSGRSESPFWGTFDRVSSRGQTSHVGELVLNKTQKMRWTKTKRNRRGKSHVGRNGK